MRFDKNLRPDLVKDSCRYKQFKKQFKLNYFK
jgi:hypothetical protein